MASSQNGKYEEVVEMCDASPGSYRNEANYCALSSQRTPNQLDLELIRALEEVKEGTNLKIIKTPPRKNYGGFNFTIRDSRGDSLLLQGEIDFRQAANISGLEGNPLFHIITLDNGHKFVTKSKTGLIGNIDTNDPSFMSLRTTEDYVYTVNIIGGEDIVISRHDTSEILVKMHIPAQGEKYEPFDCSIVFQDGLREPITPTEKTMCISVAIVYMMVRNGPIQTHGEHSSGKCSATCIGVVVGSIVIIIFMIFILYLTLNECKWKPYKPGCEKV